LLHQILRTAEVLAVLEVVQVMVLPEVLEMLVDILQWKDTVEEIILVLQHTLVSVEVELHNRVKTLQLIEHLELMVETEQHLLSQDHQ
jgi:hypothetical protein